ncbi:MAG: hypothetical protein E7161_00990 [Firmicutes bacterium]|nr:hypothetical protein [Bacillota bacterium]
MENKNKIFLIAIIILTISVIGFCVYSVINNNKLEETDAVKFRKEYMELNGKVNEANGKAYVNVTLNDTNTIKYVTEAETVELLENGTGIIYFGFSKCPWCRSLVSTLASVAEEKNETIYYLDVLDIRSSFEVKDGALNKIKDGSKGYYQILELLNDELEDFYLEDEEGNVFDTNEKRLYAPTLVAINNGEVTGFHVGTIESQASGYDKLTDEQTDELEKIITNLINSKNNEVCTQDKC